MVQTHIVPLGEGLTVLLFAGHPRKAVVQTQLFAVYGRVDQKSNTKTRCSERASPHLCLETACMLTPHILLGEPRRSSPNCTVTPDTLPHFAPGAPVSLACPS